MQFCGTKVHEKAVVIIMLHYNTLRGRMIIKRDDKDVRRHAFGSYICSSTHMVHNTHWDKTQFFVQKAIKFTNPEKLQFGIFA